MLVADFGGGTSDFSVLRFEPGRPAASGWTPLGHAGIGIAGDAFDYRIIDKVVSPLLGKGDQYTLLGKVCRSQPVLPVLRPLAPAVPDAGPKVMADIAEVTRTAEHPDRLGTW